MVQQVTVRDLLQEKKYDIVEFRCPYPPDLNLPDETMLMGYCGVENGELVSLDGDTYYDDDDVLSHEEWTTQDGNLVLTVVVDMEWS